MCAGTAALIPCLNNPSRHGALCGLRNRRIGSGRSRHTTSQGILYKLLITGADCGSAVGQVARHIA